MRCLCLLLYIAICAEAQELVFEGTVTHAFTHQPISGVHIRLVPMRNVMRDFSEAYGAQSDRAGHFRMGDLKPGTYILMPELRGFVFGQPRKGPPFPNVQLKAGENITDFKLEMIPHAVITGRVLDDDGEPIQNVYVMLEQAGPPMASANFNMMGSGLGGVTDDRGIYRIAGLPGKYYVQATLNRYQQRKEIRTDGSLPPDFITTYYPNTGSKDTAVVVDSNPGSSTSGIDIRMARSGAKNQTFTISGIVRGVAKGTMNAWVALQPSLETGVFTGSSGVVIQEDGKFVFSGVRPGKYTIMASAPDRSSAPLDITVGTSDITDLEFTVAPRAALEGALEVIGDPPGPLNDKWRIALVQVSMLGQETPRGGDVAPDGSFHFTGTSPVRMRVKLASAPHDAFVKSVVLNGTQIEGDEFALPVHDSQLKVQVSRHGASISGSVLAPDGSPVINGIASVTLVSDPDKFTLLQMSRDRTQVGPDGKYEFHGIPPGRYRIVAVDPFQSSDMNKPGTLKKLALTQPEMEIKEGAKIKHDVKVATQEETNAKPK